MAKTHETGRKRGSGRRPKEHAEKKSAVQVMIPNGIIDAMGGKLAMQKIILDFMQSHATQTI